MNYEKETLQRKKQRLTEARRLVIIAMDKKATILKNYELGKLGAMDEYVLATIDEHMSIRKVHEIEAELGKYDPKKLLQVKIHWVENFKRLI